MTDKDNDLHIEIQDDGPGFSEDVLKYIFEPFCKDNIGSHHEGTGLGLSIVHKILEQHNAMVEVLSEEGKGTTFLIKFNIHKPAGQRCIGIKS